MSIWQNSSPGDTFYPAAAGGVGLSSIQYAKSCQRGRDSHGRLGVKERVSALAGGAITSSILGPRVYSDAGADHGRPVSDVVLNSLTRGYGSGLAGPQTICPLPLSRQSETSTSTPHSHTGPSAKPFIFRNRHRAASDVAGRIWPGICWPSFPLRCPGQKIRPACAPVFSFAELDDAFRLMHLDSFGNVVLVPGENTACRLREPRRSAAPRRHLLCPGRDRGFLL